VCTRRSIVVPELTAKLALTPLNRTAVAPVKVVPLSVTLLPTGPLVGAKLVSVGGAPVKKASKMFAVVRWIRESMSPWKPSILSSAQLQDIVPAAKTHARLGAW